MGSLLGSMGDSQTDRIEPTFEVISSSVNGQPENLDVLWERYWSELLSAFGELLAKDKEEALLYLQSSNTNPSSSNVFFKLIKSINTSKQYASKEFILSTWNLKINFSKRFSGGLSNELATEIISDTYNKLENWITEMSTMSFSHPDHRVKVNPRLIYEIRGSFFSDIQTQNYRVRLEFKGVINYLNKVVKQRVKEVHDNTYAEG